MFCGGSNVLRQLLCSCISCKDVAVVNLNANDRVKCILTAVSNNTCKIIAKNINFMFKKRKEL